MKKSNAHKKILTLFFFSLIGSGCTVTTEKPAPIAVNQQVVTPAPVVIETTVVPATPAQLLAECKTARREYDFDTAILKCSEATQLKPDYFEAYIELGEIHEYDLRNTNSAVSAYLNAADILARQKRCEEPRRLYNRILSLIPNHTDAKRGLSKLNCGSTRPARRPRPTVKSSVQTPKPNKTFEGGGIWIED